MSAASPGVLIAPTDNPVLERVLRAWLEQRRKVNGSFGALEAIALRLGLMQNAESPSLAAARIIVFAADHGLAVDDIGGRSPRSTAMTVLALLDESLPLAAFARLHGIEFTVVDSGVAESLKPDPRLLARKIAHGTRNSRAGVAMSTEQAHAAMRAGMEIGHKLGGSAVACAGIGIGATESAALLLSCLSGAPLREFIDARPGVGEALRLHLLRVLEDARHRPLRGDDPPAVRLQLRLGGALDAAHLSLPLPGHRAHAALHPSPTVAPAVTRQARAAQPLPTIVVASHADRVMISLEALLANDDPTVGGFGALPEQIIVSSHAERALATLAAICGRDDADLADLHVAEAPAGSTAAEGMTPLASTAPSSADVTAPSATAAAAGRAGARAASARQETSRPASRRSALGDELVAVHEGSLDKVRGGFDAGNGLQISFGIERAVYINGSLVTTTSFNVGDLAKVVGGQAAVSAAVAGARNLTLVQNGAGNTFVTGPVSAATVGTVIQNTLNDQKIQSVTSINATVNSLQMMKAQNFEASMRGALTDALRR